MGRGGGVCTPVRGVLGVERVSEITLTEITLSTGLRVYGC